MPRYKLRTLMILLAVGPPMLAAAWFAATVLNARLALFYVVFLTIVAMYALSAVVLGFCIALVISSIINLIARLQGKR